MSSILIVIQVIIGLTALYGAIVSSYNLIMNVKKSSYKIEVRLKRGFVGISSPFDNKINFNKNHLLLSAHNIGYRTVTLTSMGFKIPKLKKELAIINPQSTVTFPFELKKGKDCLVWSDEEYIAKTLKESGLSGSIKIIGVYSDAIHNIYKSKPLKLNVDSILGNK